MAERSTCSTKKQETWQQNRLHTGDELSQDATGLTAFKNKYLVSLHIYQPVKDILKLGSCHVEKDLAGYKFGCFKRCYELHTLK